MKSASEHIILKSNEIYFDYTHSYPIYVPSGSVDAYKAAENWSEYAYRIYAISE